MKEDHHWISFVNVDQLLGCVAPSLQIGDHIECTSSLLWAGHMNDGQSSHEDTYSSFLQLLQVSR